VNHRYSGAHSGLPCAAVYGLLRALPGEPAFATVARAMPLELRADLAPCLGAPEPHGFAVRLRAARQSAQKASAAVRSTSVTIAIRPSVRSGVKAVKHDFLKNERGLFLHVGLDRANQLDATGEIRFLVQPAAGLRTDGAGRVERNVMLARNCCHGPKDNRLTTLSAAAITVSNGSRCNSGTPRIRLHRTGRARVGAAVCL